MILRDARSGVWPRRKVKVMSVEIKREGDPTPQSLRAEVTVLMCGDLEVAEGAGHRVRCHWSGPLAGFGEEVQFPLAHVAHTCCAVKP